MLILLLIKFTVILAIAGLLNSGLRKAPASTRHLIWLSALGGVLLLPLLSVILPALSFRLAHPGQGLIEITQTLTLGVSHRNSLDLGTLLVCCWFSGVFAGVVRALYAAIAVRTLARNLRPLHHPDCGVPILISNYETMPLVFRLFKPTVILPASAADWSERKRRLVLLHELAHIQRRDLWSQALAQWVTIVYWFHPLVWFAARRMKSESEMACDESVVRSGVTPSDYAAELLDVARSLQWRKSWSGRALAMARNSHLESRVHAILVGGRRGSIWTRIAVISIVLAVLLSAALRPEPPLVPQLSELPASTILIREQPVYPEAAKRRGITGIVTIRAQVARDGSVKELVCLSAPDDTLKSAAIEAARHWRYQPASVEGYTIIKIYFSLSN